MPALDVFKADAFSMASLTAAINALPYQPKYLGQAGLFSPAPIMTATAQIEKREGKLSVLSVAGRGSMPTVESQPTRVLRTFAVPHIPVNQTVRADDVLGIRRFGSETELESVAQLVNDALAQLRAMHETTFEWHRMGAIKGSIVDADGTELYNLFTEFGESEVEVDFVLGTATTDVKGKCTEVIRAVEDALGADTYSSITAWVGNDFWDKLIRHENVEKAYANWNAATTLSTQQRPGYFHFAGIDFRNYRGHLGGTPWMPDAEGRTTPTGVNQLFQHIMAPGDMIETVGTRGQAMYAKQEIIPFGKGVEIHTQSNPLMICTRPKVLVKLITSN